MLKGFLLVGVGGMIGSMLRYLFAVIIKPQSFPYATLSVNIIGCLFIGVVMGFVLKNETVNQNWKLFLATGICGGFTTFSAFSLECVQFMEQQRYAAMFSYIGLSIVLGLAATFAGIQLTRI
jgi:fluoride exporter